MNRQLLAGSSDPDTESIQFQGPGAADDGFAAPARRFLSPTPAQARSICDNELLDGSHSTQYLDNVLQTYCQQALAGVKDTKRPGGQDQDAMISCLDAQRKHEHILREQIAALHSDQSLQGSLVSAEDIGEMALHAAHLNVEEASAQNQRLWDELRDVKGRLDIAMEQLLQLQQAGKAADMRAAASEKQAELQMKRDFLRSALDELSSNRLISEETVQMEAMLQAAEEKRQECSRLRNDLVTQASGEAERQNRRLLQVGQLRELICSLQGELQRKTERALTEISAEMLRGDQDTQLGTVLFRSSGEFSDTSSIRSNGRRREKLGQPKRVPEEKLVSLAPRDTSSPLSWGSSRNDCAAPAFSTSVHGPNVMVSPDGLVATRTQGFRQAVALSADSLPKQSFGTYFQVQIKGVTKGWKGGLGIGFTSTRVSSTGQVPDKAWQIPGTLVVGYWGRSFSRGREYRSAWASDSLQPGDSVGLLALPEGSVRLFVNGRVQMAVQDVVDYSNEIFGLVDVFGATTEVEVLRNGQPPPPPWDAPSEAQQWSPQGSPRSVRSSAQS
mmetsp:Transcript_61220/g.132134  ORF Transcript_61220/g.132134 Transcript_61220/m.132134 type:complete len:557 (+) Transcript_61220:30-1700(+)|eukprot:CAMPEP_0204475698 /NCGR_PEP_ID=MMETSP0471-20130131/28481_1 /ASSEMBLY_ACC=CAM_ASM_000602 /TAXON_ID=2969 /ORGANISM="Oxyrrhis marina" /LENGTH=556 /DNA_ID=CAMNT_0051478205 /DNA_START=24 /DNA_END=1694 /DNA_ORIENTATION=-